MLWQQILNTIPKPPEVPLWKKIQGAMGQSLTQGAGNVVPLWKKIRGFTAQHIDQPIERKLTQATGYTPEQIGKVSEAGMLITGSTQPLKFLKSKPLTLIDEAKKFKSADEFVKGQWKKFIHETDAPNIKEFVSGKAGANTQDSWLGRGVYLQEDGVFKLEKYGKNKVEAYISPKAKIFEIKDTPKGKWRDNFVEEVAKRDPNFEKGLEEWRDPKNVLPRDFLMNKSPEEIRKLIGDYDGILQDGELVVFNPAVIKTKSQLIDIWNKANKNIVKKSLMPKIHPQDQEQMINFIDQVRLRKPKDLKLELDVSRIAEKYGIKMPKTTAELANEFDKVLTKIRSAK